MLHCPSIAGQLDMEINMLKMNLLILTGLLLFAGTVAAKPYATDTVAPMPNLMPIIMHHGEMLDLTEQQKTKLANWRSTHHQAQQHLKKDIHANQDAMLKAALDGKSLDELLIYEKAIDAKRIQFITRKAACRDNMKKVLSPEQWQKVMEIYREENL